MSKSYGNTIEILRMRRRLKTNYEVSSPILLPWKRQKTRETNIIFQLYRLFASPEEQEIFAEQFHAGGTWRSDKQKQHSLKKQECLSIMPFRERRKEIESKQKKKLRTDSQKEEKSSLSCRKNAKVKRKVGLCDLKISFKFQRKC